MLALRQAQGEVFRKATPHRNLTLSLSKGERPLAPYPPNLLSLGKPLGAIRPAPARLPI